MLRIEILRRIEKLREDLTTIRWADYIPDNVQASLEQAEENLRKAAEALHD